MSSPDRRADVSFVSLVLPLLEGWRVVLLVVFLASATVTAISLLSKRRYEATVTVSTVSAGRTLPTDLSGLLGNATATSLQASPALIVYLARQSGVLYHVGMRRVSASSPTRIIDRLAAVDGKSIPDQKVAAETGDALASGFDKETGLVTLTAVSSDSALARILVGAVVDEISATFLRATKAQAEAMRDALQTRVDSAQRQLLNAEEEYRSFLGRNRAVAVFSEASLEQQRLSRATDLANASFAQAVKEREVAISKGLEDAPAVVIVDPPAKTLAAVSRRIALKVVGTALFFGFFVWLILLARAAGVEEGVQGDERQRLRAALAGIPVFGFVILKVFGLESVPAAPGQLSGP